MNTQNRRRFLMDQNCPQYGGARSNTWHYTFPVGASHAMRGLLRGSNNENRRNIDAFQHRKNNNRNQNLGKGFFSDKSHHSNAHHRRGVFKNYLPPRVQRRQNNSEKPHRESNPGYEYEKLLEISIMDPTDMLLHFNNDNRNFTALLNGDLQPDIIVLAVKCVSSVCSIVCTESEFSILINIKNSNFLNMLENYIANLCHETDSFKARNTFLCRNMESFWYDVFHISDTLLDLSLSEVVDSLSILFKTVERTIQKLREPVITNAVRDMFKISKEKFSICKKKVDRKQDEIEEERTRSVRSDNSPPDNFRDIKIIPSIEELTAVQKPYLRANIIDGAYENVDHYLDVQFRLLREDFISPLREGIIAYLDNPAAKQFENIRVFKKVLFKGLKVMRGGGLGMVVVFKQSLCNTSAMDKVPESRRSIANSKKLMFGSLVCFTDDKFKTTYFATVSNRDKISDGQISVEMDENFYTNKLTGTNFLMVESEVYFLPYYYVLKALQQPSWANLFPMKKYIVNADPNTGHPRHLNTARRYKICNGANVHILQESSWPSVDKVGMDETQYAAYKMALRKEFVTIQGPPGTGKTFIGLKVAITLLKNDFSSNPPILVVCYTNHALDQFLEGLLKVTNKLVRIGGQSKSSALQDYNLQLLRKQLKKQEFKKNFDTLTKNMGKLRHRINLIQSKSVIVDLAKIDVKLDINIVEFLMPFDMGNNRCSLVNWLMMSDTVKYTSNLKNNVDESELRIDNKSDDFCDFGDSDIKDDKFKMPVLNENIFSVETLNNELRHIFQRLKTDISGEDRDEANIQAAILINEKDFLRIQLSRPNSEHHIFCDPRIHSASSFNVTQRWRLYWQWVQPVLQFLNEDFFKRMIPYKQAKDTHDKLTAAIDNNILMNTDVIGITTTAAAKSHSLLKSLKIRIVIVEEAAEVLESHIVASLSATCEHLIMIGDHQQLRPITASHELTRDFNLDISLFERMVKNGNHCYQLGVQHRMRPEIAALIAPTIYPKLKNHRGVFRFPKIKGVVKSLAFVCHEHPETKEESTSSRLNTHEAKFLLCLAKYLIQQGYKSDDITILAAYSGQMFYMKKECAKYEILSRVRITVLDSYQGDENKIILLSLVRSNPENNIGFLSTENRVCVALSRAKEGLYIIGNMNNMMSNSDLWKKINKTLMKQGAIGNSLTLKCEIHHKTLTQVQSEEDFYMVSEGGCSRICNSLLKCGHNCLSLCHPIDAEHKEYLCTANCERQVCIYGHNCPDVCSKKCNRCRVLVTHLLPCGHSTMLQCHLDANKYDCRQTVPVVLELCGHKTEKQCHVNLNEVKCQTKCTDLLPCGHACTQLCHKDSDPDHINFSCNDDSTRLNEDSVNENLSKKRCYEDCRLSTILVTVHMKKKRNVMLKPN